MGVPASFGVETRGGLGLGPNGMFLEVTSPPRGHQGCLWETSTERDLCPSRDR